ncbi:MAG: hypothetical protein A2939_01460 [Parcubacteria group bacterium RIFCSPLOWO2_01_FULL_48_18]|nr:MAG: hypothetical protein A2939_01460 [Parcubacteria group bacterium RIFCSPLOWO2_01_FULL_48_18]OHB22126.1 MAG: hypothetical protein A3J67_04370 [Parcubacteria group bacterium RIFCSPHIGHO2_02_FULL_48_10b]
MKLNIFTVLKSVIVGIVILALGGGIFYVGYIAGYQEREIIIAGVSNQENGRPADIDFGVFWEAWQVIRQNYLKSEEVDNQTLVYGAVRGLVNSLKDPHSNFLTPEDAKKFNEDVSGEFSGVGMEIGIKNGQLKVIAPLKDSPAEKAGLKAGDSILKVDDAFTNDLSVDEAVKLIRGQRGTKVKLFIFREGWEKSEEFVIVRDIITIPALEYKLIEGRLAHIQLFNFNENMPLLFYRAAVDLLLNKPKGIILDLRNNPGGFLEVSVNIAGWFLDKGVVVTEEKFKSGDANVFRANGNGALKLLPMVIIVNEGSASASEILAGALRDHRHIPLIGQKTFGKGSVQEIRNLRDNSSIKISIAQWLTPNGNLIEGAGLEPDYKVEIGDEDAKNKKDPQLEKAIEILKEILITKQ